MRPPLAPRPVPVLPPVLVMTDAVRTPDPLSVAAEVPPGWGMILRHPDPDTRTALARALAPLCRRRRVVLLIAGDLGLAIKVGADGLHLSERSAHRLPGILIRPRPGFVLTAAAHGPRALAAAARAGADAALLSPVFATRSHPGARPLGVTRLAALVDKAPLPVYALGGMDAEAARRIKPIGLAGVAGIGKILSLGATPRLWRGSRK